jgi:hypothetical protein
MTRFEAESLQIMDIAIHICDVKIIILRKLLRGVLVLVRGVWT